MPGRYVPATRRWPPWHARDLFAQILDYGLALLACAARLFSGSIVAPGASESRRPRLPLQLYEFENCPFCRRVRETLCLLDLDAEIYPCPRETMRSYGYMNQSRFRPTVKELGCVIADRGPRPGLSGSPRRPRSGALQFPFLVDPNTDTRMYESRAIVHYLWETYGDRAQRPVLGRLLPRLLKRIMLFTASLLRPLKCVEYGVGV